jgi:hypothetical protein
MSCTDVGNKTLEAVVCVLLFKQDVNHGNLEPKRLGIYEFLVVVNLPSAVV